MELLNLAQNCIKFNTLQIKWFFSMPYLPQSVYCFSSDPMKVFNSTTSHNVIKQQQNFQLEEDPEK